MTEKIRYSFTGICPHTGKRQTILINYLNAAYPGRSPSWKKDAFYCSSKDACPPAPEGDHRNCPLYQAAPTNPS